MFASDMIRNRPFFSRCCQRAVLALGAVLFSSLQAVSQANGQDGITVTAVGDVRITDRMIGIQLPFQVSQPIARRRGIVSLQPRIDGFALQCQDAEYAFVRATQRLFAHKAFQRLYAKREFPGGQRALRSQATRTQPF
jgi:hypothetical protein